MDLQALLKKGQETKNKVSTSLIKQAGDKNIIINTAEFDTIGDKSGQSFVAVYNQVTGGQRTPVRKYGEKGTSTSTATITPVTIFLQSLLEKFDVDEDIVYDQGGEVSPTLLAEIMVAQDSVHEGFNYEVLYGTGGASSFNSFNKIATDNDNIIEEGFDFSLPMTVTRAQELLTYHIKTTGGNPKKFTNTYVPKEIFPQYVSASALLGFGVVNPSEKEVAVETVKFGGTTVGSIEDVPEMLKEDEETGNTVADIFHVRWNVQDGAFIVVRRDGQLETVKLPVDSAEGVKTGNVNLRANVANPLLKAVRKVTNNIVAKGTAEGEE